MSNAQFGHILLIVLLQGLERALFEHHFPRPGKWGKVSWVMELYLWGGFVSVEWPKENRGRMSAISRMIFSFKDVDYDISASSVSFDIASPVADAGLQTLQRMMVGHSRFCKLWRSVKYYHQLLSVSSSLNVKLWRARLEQSESALLNCSNHLLLL